MFKKSKRTQIRQRIRSESEEEEEQQQQLKQEEKQHENVNTTLTGASSAVLKRRTEVNFKTCESLSNENSQQSTTDDNSSSGNGLFSKQAAKKKTTAALSFLHHEDEEVEDVFKVKKSAYSKRMERNKLKSLKSRYQNPSKDKSEANGSLTRPELSLAFQKTDEESGSGSSKPPEAKQSITEGDFVICPGSDEDEDEVEEEIRFMTKSSLQLPAFSKSKSKAAIGSCNQVHNFRNAVERGTIPDAKVIYELKKQRQKLARTRAADDFIPLNSDDEETLRQESNLLGGGKGDDAVEEGESDMDENDEDDEDEERIQFGKVDYKTKERERAKEAFRMAQEEKEEQQQLQRRKKNTESEDDDYSSEDSSESTTNRKKNGLGINQHDTDSDSDSASELDRWEQEQIRKAVCLPSLAAFNETEFLNRYLHQKPSTTVANNKPLQTAKTAAAAARIADNHSVVPIEIDGEEEEGSSTRRFGSALPSYISNSTSKSNIKSKISSGDFSTVHKRQAELRRTLTDSLESNRALLDRVQLDVRLTAESIEQYRKTGESVALENGQFFQETLDYVCNLCDCITNKREALERAERQALEHWSGRAARQTAEAAAEMTAQNDAVVQLIIHLKINAEQYAAVVHGASIFEYYDFGGDEVKRQRLLALETKLRRRSLASIVQGSTGASEDEDEEGIEEDQIASIRLQLEELFEDTEEEYATLTGVLGRFAAWKRTRLDTYAESFAGAFVATFAVYYLRHQLVLWNPFDSKTATFEDPFRQMECLRSLVLYGALEEKEETLDTKAEAKWRAADLEIVPAAFEKVIFPKLTALVSGGVWNPFSRRKTSQLTSFLRSVLRTCPTLVDSSSTTTTSSSPTPALATLLQAIVQRLETVLDSEIFIPNMIPPEFFDRSAKRSHYETLAISYVTAFFHRQFWAAVQLLRSAVALRGIVADYVLKELALERLLSRVLLISISRSAADGDALITQIGQIVEVLPEEWCARSSQQQQHPTIAKFADLIQQLAEAPTRRPEHRKKLVELRIKLDQ